MNKPTLSLPRLTTTVLFVLFFLFGGVVCAGDFYSQMGIAGNMSSCETVGGKATSTINDPAKLIAAGLSGSKAGDKLEVTRISKDTLLIKNLLTGGTVKLGYGYEGVGGEGSGYLGKEAPAPQGTRQ